jgi:hypothetical protein
MNIPAVLDSVSEFWLSSNPSGYLTIYISGTSLDDGGSTIFASSSTSVASNVERKALSSLLMEEEPFLGFLEFFAGDSGL